MLRSSKKTLRMENLEAREMKTGDMTFETPDETLEGIVFVCYPPGDDGAENDDEYENGYCDIYITAEANDSSDSDSPTTTAKSVEKLAKAVDPDLADYVFGIAEDDEVPTFRGSEKPGNVMTLAYYDAQDSSSTVRNVPVDTFSMNFAKIESTPTRSVR